MQARVRLESNLLAVESEHRVYAMLEVAAPSTRSDGERQPLNIALVIDRSGSMAGPKLAVTRECARYLVRRLAPRDRLGLVVYDDQVNLLAPLAAVDHTRLDAAIARLLPGGSTNLSGGWLKGAELLRGADGEGTRKILLLTDGLANVGITEPAALVDMTRSVAEQGIGTSTIGFGHEFDEDLLTAMADAGRGNAHYAETPDEAPGIFADEFESLARLVAQNVSVEIRPTSDVGLIGVLNDYPVVALAGGLQIELGDAYAEELRRVVFELHVPEMARLGVAKVADVIVRYTAVGPEVATHELTLPININMVSAEEAKGRASDAEVVEHILVLRAARAEEEARKKADEGDFDGAALMLRRTSEELRKVAPQLPNKEVLHSEADRLDEWHGVLKSGHWSAAASKAAHFASHSMQRSRPRRRPKPGPQQDAEGDSADGTGS